MVHSPGGFCNWLAGDVGQKVCDPSSQLLDNKSVQGIDWGVASHLLEHVGVLGQDKLVSLLGHKHHVSVHVTGGLVVLSVGKLPREVRHHPVRVQHPPDKVVEPAVIGEGLVTALVGQNPESGAEKALDDRISGPSSESQVHAQQERNVGVSSVSNGHHARNVSGDKVQRLSGSSLVAVRGNSRQNVLYGVIWSLELVAVGVNGSQVGGKRSNIASFLNG